MTSRCAHAGLGTPVRVREHGLFEPVHALAVAETLSVPAQSPAAAQGVAAVAALTEEHADMTMHTHERTAPTDHYTRQVDLSPVAVTGILPSKASCLCMRRPRALAFTRTPSTALLR